MRPIQRFVGTGVILAAVALLTGCGDRRPSLGYGQFLSTLTTPDRMARLDVPSSTLISSFDRSGGNDDFNNFTDKGSDGWAVLADLKGPGVVTRFWTTGGKDAKQRLQFFFDNEKTPRIDATVSELQKGKAPGLVPPLCRYEQSCWWCYVPLTFNKRLRILADGADFSRQGGPRLFYQLNWARTTAEQSVESFPARLAPEHLAALERYAATWEWAEGIGQRAVGRGQIVVPPGQRRAFEAIPGPAVLNGLEFSFTAVDSNAVVSSRDLLVRITWDDAAQASVTVPLGPLCGDLWFSPSFESRFFGLSNGVFACRFPMPFKKNARIEIENLAKTEVSVQCSTSTCHPSPSDRLSSPGYFHASWSRTEPTETGRPHSVLQAQGRGKYVGCLLGVINFDRTWWLLEGDETIRTDGAATPQWRGTGLEDYFNCAWYYKNNLTRPLHGLVFKSPFRTVQYRIHTEDAPAFVSSVDVQFERGPDQASHGLMESVAFYYLDKPAAAPSAEATSERRALPSDPMEQGTIMLDLANYERFGDYRRAYQAIDRYLNKNVNVPFVPMLRLRQIAYLEQLDGIDAARPLYRQFAATEKDPAAVKYAELLLWFHESPTNALMSLFCVNQARGFVDDRVVVEVNDPQAFGIAPVTLGRGAHVLAIESRHKQYPEWVQACLRTHQGYVMTDGDWQFEFRPAGDAWQRPGFDTRTWAYTGNSMVEGPPMPPHIWTSPHPFVDMQAKPLGVWVSTQWPANKSVAVFRKEFEVR